MLNLERPAPSNQYHQAHTTLLLESYRKLLKQTLMPFNDGESLGRQVFEAEFALLSHNSDNDPLFNYANRTALDLFEFSWDEFIGMPSRLSAEPVNREERERLLAEVTLKRFIDNYSGVRIAKSGKRFLIRQAVVWNVFDKNDRYCGQAACFKDWELLP